MAKQIEESGAIEKVETGLKAVEEVAAGLSEQEKKATSLLDKLRQCKSHATLIKTMRKKAEECRKHQNSL